MMQRLGDLPDFAGSSRIHRQGEGQLLQFAVLLKAQLLKKLLHTYLAWFGTDPLGGTHMLHIIHTICPNSGRISFSA